jgi:hypothetical protein
VLQIGFSTSTIFLRFLLIFYLFSWVEYGIRVYFLVGKTATGGACLSASLAPRVTLGLARRGGGVHTPLLWVYKPHSDSAAVLPVVVPLTPGKPRRAATFLVLLAAANLSTAVCRCSSMLTEPSPACHREAAEADERC